MEFPAPHAPAPSHAEVRATLSVQVGAANEAYARSVGKTADSLTDAEKKLAFNVVFFLGVSFYFPTSFQYTTRR